MIYGLCLKGTSDNAELLAASLRTRSHTVTQPSLLALRRAGELQNPASQHCGLGTRVEKLTVNVIFECGSGFEDDFIMKSPFCIFIFIVLSLPGLM